MKNKHWIRTLGRLVCGVCLLVLSACIADDFHTQPGNGAVQGPGLYLALQTPGEMQPVVTRAAGVDDLNENRIETVDIFLFKEDGTLNTEGYRHGTPDAEGVVMLYQGSNWQTTYFDRDETYTVYVLANYKGETNLAEIKTLDNLKNVRAKDEEIVFFQGMPGYNGEKNFLMDGKADVQQDKFPNDNTPYLETVRLSRAAVKVEVTINLSESWAKKFTPFDLEAQVTNYATVTPATADGLPIDDATQRGFQTYPTGESDAKDNFTENFVIQGESDAIAGSLIRFYAYVNRWDDLATNETMLLIDMPGKYTEDETVNADKRGELLEHNFYKIPIIRNGASPILERNTYYHITATVDMEGNSDVDEPVELKDVRFKTADWKPETITVGKDDTPTFLVLSEYVIDMRDTDTYGNLEFYSSSEITKVEFVGFNNQTAAENAGINFTYPGNGTEIPPIYFVNKKNQRQEVDIESEYIQVQTGTDWWGRPEYEYQKNPYYQAITAKADKGTNGHINLTSPTPTNVTKRYFTLKVTNADNISKYVVIEQYPLQYIQPIAGYYSYRDDLKKAGGTYEEQGKNYATYSYREGWNNIPSSNDYFDSKVISSNGNNILQWFWGKQYNQVSLQTKDGNTGNENNMMYFVTITQTNEEYKLAHPLSEEVQEYGDQTALVNSEENDELISPSFMLASTLGAVNSSRLSAAGGWTEARKHCAYYAETYIDSNGKTQHLTDWRLPTSAEVAIIVKYQNAAPDVMDEVLGGQYYYVCWRGARNGAGNAPTNIKGASSGTYVRCIRDVKPTDAFLQSTND